MADSFTITVEAEGLLALLNTLGERAKPVCLAESKRTADAIKAEAYRRFARREAGPTRGGEHTAEGLTVEPTYNGDGYVVFVKSPNMPMLPEWLEFGTKFMTPHPTGGALFPSAQLEEMPYQDHLSTALQDLLDSLS